MFFGQFGFQAFISDLERDARHDIGFDQTQLVHPIRQRLDHELRHNEPAILFTRHDAFLLQRRERLVDGQMPDDRLRLSRSASIGDLLATARPRH